MKNETAAPATTTKHHYKFVLGARPPRNLTAAQLKILDSAEPSRKAHELAARVAKTKVVIQP